MQFRHVLALGAAIATQNAFATPSFKAEPKAGPAFAQDEGIKRGQENLDFLRADSFFGTLADAILNKVGGGKVDTKPGIDPTNPASKNGFDMGAGAYLFAGDTAATTWNSGKTTVYVALGAGDKAERISLTLDTYEFSKNRAEIQKAIKANDVDTLTELLVVCRPLNADKKPTDIARAFVWDATSADGKKAAPAGGPADKVAKAVNAAVAKAAGVALNVNGQEFVARYNKAPAFRLG